MQWNEQKTSHRQEGMLAAFGQQPAATGADLDGDGIDDDLEFAFEDDPLYYR